MCGVWIALEDVEPGCGPLTYYPGSHKLPVLTMRGAGVNRSDPKPDDYERYYQKAAADRLEVGGFAQEEALLRKGQALVWAANLSHGGAAITRPESTRRSLVVHFFFENCVYHTPMLSDVEGDRLHARIPFDARTGRWVWPRRRGWPTAVSLHALAVALLDTLTRPVHRF
jgi:ectoine hydroxylase-related dioxygenase (phytanoyl-CoA dioxygenase family)